MKDLVTLSGKVPVTATLIIAEVFERPHKGVIQLVRKYEGDLKEAGPLTFQMAPRSLGKHGGGDTEYANLNEEQSLLLLMHMRSTGKVTEAKKQLAKAFVKMRNTLAELKASQTSPAWLSAREDGKSARRLEMDELKEFVEYAESSGSNNAFRYYSLVTTMTYKAMGDTFRER